METKQITALVEPAIRRIGRHTVVPRATTYRMGNTSRQSEGERERESIVGTDGHNAIFFDICT